MDKAQEFEGEKIRVLIVDDHAMVRQGLRTFLELQDDSSPPIEVVGEAVNGAQAVELARRTQPNIILLDLMMPDGWHPGNVQDHGIQPKYTRHHPHQFRRRR